MPVSWYWPSVVGGREGGRERVDICRRSSGQFCSLRRRTTLSWEWWNIFRILLRVKIHSCVRSHRARQGILPLSLASLHVFHIVFDLFSAVVDADKKNLAVWRSRPGSAASDVKDLQVLSFQAF